MFEQPELPNADKLHSQADRLIHRALDYALAAGAHDLAALRIGVEAAYPYLMSHPPSDDVWEKCVAVCERALDAAEAGRSDDMEALSLGVQAAQLVTTLRGMSGHVTMVVNEQHRNLGFGAFDMQPPSPDELDAASHIQLTSSEPSGWLLDGDDENAGDESQQ